MTPNVEVIRRAVHFLREHETSFCMGYWWAVLGGPEAFQEKWVKRYNLRMKPDGDRIYCFCIAVYFATLRDGEIPPVVPSVTINPRELAKKWGLTQSLFHLDFWPPDAISAYMFARTHKERIDALVLAIRLMTGVDAEPSMKEHPV